MGKKDEKMGGGTDKIEGIGDYEINRLRKILKSLKSTEKTTEERRQDKWSESAEKALQLHSY